MVLRCSSLSRFYRGQKFPRPFRERGRKTPLSLWGSCPNVDSRDSKRHDTQARIRYYVPGIKSYWPAISADGRYIVFDSDASNLVPGDTNGYVEVFRVLNPLAPADPPHVLSVTPNLTTVTDNNLGTAKFQVRIAFDKDMNLSSTPTLIISPNVAGTLTQSAGWWINKRIFYAQYDVTDANVNVSNISLVLWGAKDASGNAQAAYHGPSGFSIDTLDPAPAPPAVLSATPSVATVTDNNVGTAAFSVRIVYNEPMNTNLNPVVTFSPDVASTLTYNRAQSWWVSNTTFVARFDVADANVAVANVGINVTAHSTPPAASRRRTAAPALQHRHAEHAGAPAAVLGATPNLALVTDNNLGTATFAVRIVYNAAMNTNLNPVVTFTPDVASTLTFEPRTELVDQR